MTAADARSHLVQLEAERALARVEGLEDKIDEWRRRYIATALSEFASLRAHGGPRTREALHDERPGRYDWPSQASTLSRFSATQS
jgi:hypothetical protein